MSSKEGLVKSLLSPSGSSGVSSGPLISEVGAPAVSPVEPPAPPAAADGPTMLEMMMAAQAEAKKEKEVEVEVQKKKTTKSFGDGFKKGFFGSEPKPKSKTTSTATSATTPTTTTAANGVTKPAATSSPSPASSSSSSIPTISKPKAHVSSASSSSTSAATLVLDEVQEAMREDENPMVKQLKQGEWMTPDLMAKMQANPVVAAGLRSRKCTVALELMQRDPKEAKRRFGDDPEIDLFMKHFGQLMSAHFEQLAQVQQQAAGPTIAPPPPVQELGPLHADVIKRSKEIASDKTSEPVDEKQVQQVLADPELRALLMDPAMQVILQECGDPVKFQRHMRDPVTSGKIKKLFDSGLVGMAK